MAGAQWVRLDVGYLTNPKLRRAGRDGVLLHLSSVLYLADHDIGDGVLPVEALPIVAASAWVSKPEPVARRLVDVGLWHVGLDTPGYLVHDYDVLNGDRSEAAHARRRQAAKRDRDRSRLRSIGP